MDKETKARRRQLLARQVEIEEHQCAGCPKRPGHGMVIGCGRCPFGKELIEIGIQLDRTIQDARAGARAPKIGKVTPEMVRVALSRGIPAETLKQRVYNLGWDTMRAVTQPVRKRGKQVGR